MKNYKITFKQVIAVIIITIGLIAFLATQFVN